MKKQTLNEQLSRIKNMMGLNENIYGASGWEGGAADKGDMSGEVSDNNVGELNYNEQSGNMESFEKLKEMISSPCEIGDVESYGRNRGHLVCRNGNSRLEVGFKYDDMSFNPTTMYFYSTDGIDQDFEYIVSDDPNSSKYVFNKMVDTSELMDKIKENSDYIPDDTDMPGFEGTMDNLNDL